MFWGTENIDNLKLKNTVNQHSFCNSCWYHLTEADLRYVEHICRRGEQKFSLSQKIITVLLSYAVV